MTPEAFLADIVMPTVREFLEAPGDRRLAYLACISAYHLGDYISRADGISKFDARAPIKAACRPSFEVVEGICNGSKHCGRNGRGAFDHKPGTEEDILPFGFGAGCGGFGMGRFGGTAGLAVDHDGRQMLVDLCLLDFLRAAASAYPTRLSAASEI